MSGPGLVEDGAEQHKQEYEAGRHLDRNAENGFAGEPMVAGQTGHRDAAVRNDVRHRLPENRVNNEQRGDDDKGPADAAPGRLEQQQDAAPADHDFERHLVTGKVDLQEHSRPQGDVVPREDQIEGHETADQRQDQIGERNAAGGRFTGGRKDQIDEDQSEGQMDGPRGNVGNDQETELVRKRRGDPKLIERPKSGNTSDDDGSLGTVLAPRVFDVLQGFL